MDNFITYDSHGAFNENGISYGYSVTTTKHGIWFAISVKPDLDTPLGLLGELYCDLDTGEVQLTLARGHNIQLIQHAFNEVLNDRYNTLMTIDLTYGVIWLEIGTEYKTPLEITSIEYI